MNSEDPDIGGKEWAGECLVSSELAHVVLIGEGKILDGEEGSFSLMDWRSKSSQRVCRSTFVGETMVCCDPLEPSLYLRSLFISFAQGHLIDENEWGAHIPVYCIFHCKSLYDHLLREGTPKAPIEKRLAIDLADLSQILMKEARHQFLKKFGANQEPTPSMPCRPPIHRIPTELSLAVILTKELKAVEWWTPIEKGRFFSRFDRSVNAPHHSCLDLTHFDVTTYTGQLYGPRVRIYVRRCFCNCKLLMSWCNCTYIIFCIFDLFYF